jgi:hypothetical protein
MVSAEQARRRAFLPTMAGMMAAWACAGFSVLIQEYVENAFQEQNCCSYSSAPMTLSQESHPQTDIAQESPRKKHRVPKSGARN